MSAQIAYYGLSMPISADRFAQVVAPADVPAHGSLGGQVENRPRLDGVTDEDQARNRAGHGAHDLANSLRALL